MEPKDFDSLRSLASAYDARFLILELGRAMVEEGNALIESAETDANLQKARALVTSGQKVRNVSSTIR